MKRQKYLYLSFVFVAMMAVLVACSGKTTPSSPSASSSNSDTATPTFTITLTNVVAATNTFTPTNTRTVTSTPTVISTPHLITQFGSYGTGTSQFRNPEAIAVDSTGYVYISDTGNSRIEKFNNDGTYNNQWTEGSGSNPGIATSPSGNIYLCDNYNSQIIVTTSTGVFVRTFGTAGTGNGQFASGLGNGPAGVVTDSAGNVYITDNANNRVEKFTSDGTYILQWGSTWNGSSFPISSADGAFEYPGHIAIDSSGYVYVADNGNGRIQKFTSTGSFVNKIGDGTYFTNLRGLAVNTVGTVFAGDYLGSYPIRNFTSGGSYITGWGTTGSSSGQIGYAMDIAVDPSNNIFVLDYTNNKVLKYGL